MKYPITNKWGETVEPANHMRERIAASIRASRPSNYSIKEHIDIRLRDPVGYFLYSLCEADRKLTEEWADNFLIALESAGIQMSEINEDMERW